MKVIVEHEKGHLIDYWTQLIVFTNQGKVAFSPAGKQMIEVKTSQIVRIEHGSQDK